MIYQIWSSPDGTQTLLLPIDHPQHYQTTLGMKLITSFQAMDWEEANDIYNDYLNQ